MQHYRTALVLGLLAGLAMAAIERGSSSGPLTFVPYVALAVLLAVGLRLTPGGTLSDRVYAATAGLVLATLVLYVFIGAVDSNVTLSAAGHAWRLGMVLALSFVIATSVAFLSARRGEKV